MKIHLPPFGPDLPIHPFTGLTALGLRRNGVPIWPVKGGAPDDAADAVDSSGDGGDGDANSADDLGDAGKQAIDRMKAERNAARKELRDVKGQLEKLLPLQKLADALAGSSDGDGDGKPDIDAVTARLARHEEDLKLERLARFRAEVAAEKGLTAAQAKRLLGATKEELAADADELLKTFQPAGEKSARGPRPDPSQGSRSGKPITARDQAMAEIQKRFGNKSTVT